MKLQKINHQKIQKQYKEYLILRVTLNHSKMQNNELTACLNPACLNPAQRIFQPWQSHFHNKCQQWLINAKIFQNYNNTKHITDNQIFIDFQQGGIKSVFMFANISCWPQRLTNLFDEFKNTILKQIDRIKQQKIIQFTEICNKVQKAYIKIKQIANNLSEIDKKPQLLHLHPQSNLISQQLQQLPQIPAINISQLTKASRFYNKELLKSLRIFGNLLQSNGYTYDQLQQKKNRKSIEKTNQYFFQNNINSSTSSNQKVQKIATLLKKQMVKATYDGQIPGFKANCWFCNSICSSPKQDPTRNGCMQSLLIHFSQSHARQVFHTFMRKNLKYQVQQVNYFTFIQKIRFQQIQQVYVIDRENAGKFDKPLHLDLEQNKVWIQVVNKDNRKLAKASYMIAESNRKDAADILITVLVYEMLDHNVGKIMLVTKDHFGEALVQIIQKFFPGRIQCILPKQLCEKFEGFNMEIQ